METSNIIPEGYYKAKPVEMELAEAGTNKTPQVAVRFQFTEEAGELAGRTIVWYGYLTEKTLARTVESLRYMGWQGTDLSDLSTATGDVVIVVGHEEYEGKLQARVKFVNSGHAPLTKNPLDEAGKKAFARSMAGAIAALGVAGPRQAPKPNGAAKPAVRPPEPPPHSDADSPGEIPF